MTRLHTMLLATCAVLSGLAGPGITRAQHLGVLVQQVDGQLVTGKANFDNYQFVLGQRVYPNEFDSDYAINLPGFASMGSGSSYLPAGSESLPGETDLEWDFLSLTVDDVSQNLFYWDGSDTDGVPGLTPDDVAFGSLPGPDYLISLWDESSTKYSIDGSDEMVSGGIIDESAADGSLHAHRWWTLEDGDGNSGTLPADGIYLFSLQLRMDGVEMSDPIYMVFGTPGSSVDALDDAAVPWVEENVDILIPPGLPGDFDEDGDVDGRDFLAWQRGESPDPLSPGDLTAWQTNFGNPSLEAADTPATHAVPEPTSMIVALVGITLIGCCERRRRWNG